MKSLEELREILRTGQASSLQGSILGVAKVLKAFQNQGGFCDCEVLANVVG